MRKIKIISIVLGIVFLGAALLSAVNGDLKGVVLNVIVCGAWVSLARLINDKVIG